MYSLLEFVLGIRSPTRQILNGLFPSDYGTRLDFGLFFNVKLCINTFYNLKLNSSVNRIFQNNISIGHFNLKICSHLALYKRDLSIFKYICLSII
jgi:hypothetical protein